MDTCRYHHAITDTLQCFNQEGKDVGVHVLCQEGVEEGTEGRGKLTDDKHSPNTNPSDQWTIEDEDHQFGDDTEGEDETYHDGWMT